VKNVTALFHLQIKEITKVYVVPRYILSKLNYQLKYPKNCGKSENLSLFNALNDTNIQIGGSARRTAKREWILSVHKPRIVKLPHQLFATGPRPPESESPRA
jgi:hypothetical protein